jgi:VanZ family protein
MPTSLTRARSTLHSLGWFISTWLPPALGVFVICGESTEAMGAAHTSHFLRPIFEHFFGPISDAAWSLFHHILRKSGHFCGYGTLSLLWLRAWHRTLHASLPSLDNTNLDFRAGAIAIVSTFVVACSDEYHQTFLPGRQGLFSDALLDTAGAVTFHLLLLLALQLRRRKA